MDRASGKGVSGIPDDNGSEPTTAPANDSANTSSDSTSSIGTSKAAPMLNSLKANVNAPDPTAAYHLIRYKNGNQALQLDNGLELISLKDGTKIGRLPNGCRYIIQPDGTTTCIARDGTVMAQ